MDQRKVYQRRSLSVENHPRQGRRQDDQNEKPAQAIKIWPRTRDVNQRDHHQTQRQQREWIVHPVNRPEHDEQREDLHRRMQPVNEGSAVDIKINRHQRGAPSAFTNSSGLSALIPKRRPSNVTSGARNDELSSNSSRSKNPRTGPS